MKKWVCPVCGYVHEGDQPPAECPKCKAPGSKFFEQTEFGDDHVIGVASGADEAILNDLRKNFLEDSKEIGIYLAMSRAAQREGYPEIGEILQRLAYEEADHASKLAELLGEELTSSTKQNLIKLSKSEQESYTSKKAIATITKKLNLDAIHDSTHEMARDETRHGKIFKALLDRYFK